MNNFSVSPKDLNKFLKYYYDMQSDKLSRIIDEKNKQIGYIDKYIEQIKNTLDDLTELQSLKNFKLVGTFKWSRELAKTEYHKKLTNNNLCKLFRTGENDKLDSILYSSDVIILEYDGNGYVFTKDGTLNHKELSDISKFINTNRINFSERLNKVVDKLKGI